MILEICNTLGKKIKTLVKERQTTGQYRVRWDTRDETGNIVINGFYFCTLRTKNNIITHKMILLH